MVTYCPRCGGASGAGAGSCRRCGQRFEALALFADAGPPCDGCGHQGASDATYCVRCGATLCPQDSEVEDTVFAGLRPEPAKARAGPGPVRTCVVCGHANPAAAEFCRHCETVLPEGLTEFARARDDDTVPGTSRAAVAKSVSPTLPVVPESSIERVLAAPAALDDAPTLRLTLADLDAARRPEPSPAPLPKPPPAEPPLLAADPEVTVTWARPRSPAPPPSRPPQMARPVREEDIETRQMEDWPELPQHPDARPAKRRRWGGLVAAGIVVVAGLGVTMLIRSLSAAGEAPRAALPPDPTPAATVLPSAPMPGVAARPAVVAAPAAEQASRPALPTAAAEKPRQALAPVPAASRRVAGSAPDAQVARSAEVPAHARSVDIVAAPPTETRSASGPLATTSVQQACSSAGNFLAEQLCRVQQCQRPEQARDPVCVNFRRMEEQQGRSDAP